MHFSDRQTAEPKSHKPAAPAYAVEGIEERITVDTMARFFQVVVVVVVVGG